jgi:hypothetical protein
MTFPTVFLKGIVFLLLLLLGNGCDGQRRVREAPLPASQQGVTLKAFEPPEVLDQIGEWYPGDWRLQFFQAMMDTSHEGRLQGLRKSDSLKPQEPVLAYHLCLAYLERDSLPEMQLARPYLEKALALDPENGVLRVMLAYLLLRADEVPKARTLFMDPRRVPGGDFYYPRMEAMLMGLFSSTNHLHPYTLTEAVEIFRRIPFPPFEKWINILYSVFLSPLTEHPYDIRIRGRDAAHSLYVLGKQLRVQSYADQRVLYRGYEQRVLGFMFQLKAAEFQTLFYQTFPDSLGAENAYRGLVQAQAEYEVFQAGQPWRDSTTEVYLDMWGALIERNPGMQLSEAVKAAHGWGLWRRAASFRYPAADDP